MDYKFIQPVSMQVTQEQYERDLREPLLMLEYKEDDVTDWDESEILVTNFNGENEAIGIVADNRKNAENRHFIPEYNPKLFLAIAAMTDKETPIVGEWLVCIDEMANIISGYEIGEFVKNGTPNITLGWFRRATLQELIEKFTNKETIKESAMKIEVIKPKEEVKWNFPCKGICDKTGLVVGFIKEGRGCVLEKGQTNYKLYAYDEFWNMSTFIPLEQEKENGNNYDWSNAEFPILAKIINEEVFMIQGFDEVDYSVNLTAFSLKYLCIGDSRISFASKEKRVEWLKSLEILPKGTEIKITL